MGQDFSAVVVAAIVVLAALLAAPLVVPLVAPLRRAPIGDPKRLARQVRFTVAALALALWIGGLAIPVFLGAVVLNLTLGAAERAPFSVYAMFSRASPTTTTVRVRIEGKDDPSLRRHFARSPVDVSKRYHHELRLAGGDSTEVSPELEPERTAAAGLATYLDEGRRTGGRGGVDHAVHIELVELRFDGRGLDRRVHHLLTMPGE